MKYSSMSRPSRKLDEAGSFDESKPKAAAKPAKATAKKDDVVIEDISDEPINLDDIPF